MPSPSFLSPRRPFARRLALGALLLPSSVVAALAAAPAGADGSAPVAIEWQGADECQAAARVSSEVRRLLGGGDGSSGLVARMGVKRAGERWHMVLTMERGGKTTTRELDAESCAAAADAAAVILALTIDPSHALGPEEDAALPAPDAPSAMEPDARIAPDAGEPDAANELPDLPDAAGRPPFPLYLVATGASDTGMLPRTAFGFGGGLGFQARFLRAEAAFAYWPTVAASYAAAPSRGGSFDMKVLDLRACALAEAGILEVGPCAGGGFTWMQAQGFGVSTPISAGASWGSFVADALVVGRISRLLSLRFSADVAVPFSRPTFDVVGLGVVHQPAAAALELRAGGEVHF